MSAEIDDGTSLDLSVATERHLILYAENPSHSRWEGVAKVLSILQFLFGAPPDSNLAARQHKQIPCSGLAGWAAWSSPLYQLPYMHSAAHPGSY